MTHAMAIKVRGTIHILSVTITDLPVAFTPPRYAKKKSVVDNPC